MVWHWHHLDQGNPMAVDNHFSRHWQGFAHLICIGSYRQWEETVGLSAIELMMVGPLDYLRDRWSGEEVWNAKVVCPSL
jgi:hypothetical protein